MEACRIVMKLRCPGAEVIHFGPKLVGFVKSSFPNGCPDHRFRAGFRPPLV